MPTKKKGATATAAPKAKPKGKKAEQPLDAGLPLVYGKLDVEWHLGDDALTAENAKEMLGWEEEPGHVKWGDDFLLTDRYGRKIRCTRNSRNRPFNENWAMALAFDILNKNWADSRNGPGRTINGETIIIGRHGSVLSAQHRLAGLVLAHQWWEMQPHWKDDVWGETPPTMEALVVVGVDEGPATVRTLDNTRPRTAEDVFVTEGSVFGRARAGERREMCKVLGAALKTIWERTGAKEDAWHPFRTHSESVEFVARHPRLARAVKHIAEENKRRKGADGKPGEAPIRRYVHPGTAAAMLYLMGAGATEGDNYWSESLSVRGDNLCKWSYWERATEFWTDLAAGRLVEINNALAALAGPEGTGVVEPSMREAVLCKAWFYYKDNDPFAAEDVVPRLTPPNEIGKRFLDEPYDLGGIDVGRAPPGGSRRHDPDEGDDGEEGAEDEGEGDPAALVSDPRAAEEQPDEPGPDDPTPEDIRLATERAQEEREAEKVRRREERRAKLAANRARKRAAKLAAGAVAHGDDEEDGNEDE